MPIFNFRTETTLTDGTVIEPGLQYITPRQMARVPNKPEPLVKQQAKVHARDLTNILEEATRWHIIAKTADFTITLDESRTMFTNRDATGKITATLPSNENAVEGVTVFRFFAFEQYAIRVEPYSGDLIWGFSEVGQVPVSAMSPPGIESTGLRGEMLELLYIGNGIWGIMTQNGDWE